MEQLIQRYFNEIDLSRFDECEEAIDKATCCSECLGKQYFDGNAIDYSCEQKRKIYVLRYLPVHLKEVSLAASRIPQEVFDRLFRSGSIRVLSLGSGPGSDIAAIKEVLIEEVSEDAEVNVKILRADIVSDWDPIARDVLDLRQSEQINLEDTVLRLDLAHEVYQPQERFDIITLSYLISEFGTEDIPRLAATIQNCLKKETVILINDRFQDAVIEKTKLLLADLNLTFLEWSDASERCDVIYPENVSEFIWPKLNTRSIRFTIVSQA